jgi:hypothetical protein
VRSASTGDPAIRRPDHSLRLRRCHSEATGIKFRTSPPLAATGFGGLGRAERHLRSDPGSAQAASARIRGCKASGAGHRTSWHPSPNPGATADPRCPELVPRRDKHGDPAHQRCRPSGTPPRTAIHGLAALMLTTCCLQHGAVASMKPAGRPPHPGLRLSGRDPQWRPRPRMPVLDGPQCRVPGRAELRLFKPGHPRCPRRCSVVRCGRKLLEPWTTALATGEPAFRSFVTGLR